MTAEPAPRPGSPGAGSGLCLATRSQEGSRLPVVRSTALGGSGVQAALPGPLQVPAPRDAGWGQVGPSSGRLDRPPVTREAGGGTGSSLSFSRRCPWSHVGQCVGSDIHILASEQRVPRPCRVRLRCLDAWPLCMAFSLPKPGWVLCPGGEDPKPQQPTGELGTGRGCSARSRRHAAPRPGPCSLQGAGRLLPLGSHAWLWPRENNQFC